MLEHQLAYVLDDARAKLENWRQDYNHFRPYPSLTDTAPALFARQFAIALTPSDSLA